jgi:Cu/Ag efflux protein CusF
MTMKQRIPCALAGLLLICGVGWAAGEGQAEAGKSPALAAREAAALTEGEVRKVDAENRKLTLKHGEIRNLGMPGMTMVFQVKDPSMLDALKPGDKVRFRVEKEGAAFVVTRIEAAR